MTTHRAAENSRRLFSHGSGGLRPTNQSPGRAVLPLDAQGRSLPRLFQPLVPASIPGPCLTLISASIFTWPAPLRLLLLFSAGVPGVASLLIGWRAPLDHPGRSHLKILRRITAPEGLLPKKVTLAGAAGVEGTDVPFCGHHSTHRREFLRVRLLSQAVRATPFRGRFHQEEKGFGGWAARKTSPVSQSWSCNFSFFL